MDTDRAKAIRLDSWKEIASYLDKNTRTVMRWERWGLPVHRVPGGKHHAVFAYSDELDRWLAGGGPEPRPESRPNVNSPEPTAEAGAGQVPAFQHVIIDEYSVRDPEVHPGVEEPAFASVVPAAEPRHGNRLPLIALFLLLPLLVGALTLLVRPANPMAVSVDKDIFTAVDSRGEILWRRALGELSPTYYSPGRNWSWVGDIDGDGRNEVLLTYSPGGSTSQGDVLYCFDRSGKELWHFAPGHSIRTQSGSFDPPFQIDEFTVVAQNGQKNIVLASHHPVYFPAQVARLSPAGHLLGEYWHSGHLNFVRAADLEHTGHPKVYLGGVDNGLHAATLVVLDLELINGASSEPDPPHSFTGVEPGREIARLLFPRGCMEQLYPSFNTLSSVTLSDTGIQVGVREFPQDANTVVLYDISPQGVVLRVDPTDSFYEAHRRLAQDHRLAHQWSASELDALRLVRNIVAR